MRQSASRRRQRSPASTRSSCWYPFTHARARAELRYGSSPFDSMMRPQRGSRAISTIGEKTQAMPSARDSSARNPGDGFGRRRIPARCNCQRNWKRGAMPVNHVEPEDNGDVQPRFFHGDVLVVVGALRSHHVEHRTNLALRHQFVIGQVRGRRTSCKSGGVLHRLRRSSPQASSASAALPPGH